MWTMRGELAGFESIAENDRLEVFDCFLEGLTRSCVAWLRVHPNTPPLYAAGVKYIKEPPGEDVWQDIPRTVSLGGGDCEDLAAWRCAELRFAGETRARCVMQRYRDPATGRLEYHVVVCRADGSMEDPSRLLGMR